MSNNELAVLALLLDNPQGLYGSDIVRLSNGQVGRGVVYSVLETLVASESVRELEEPVAENGLARTRHFITEKGRRALHEQHQGIGALPPIGIHG